MTTTRENARENYKANLQALDNNSKAWTKTEINEFKKNGIKEINEYGWYYTALDYNSNIIVLKHLMKKS